MHKGFVQAIQASTAFERMHGMGGDTDILLA